jgi:hypothetical protein
MFIATWRPAAFDLDSAALGLTTRQQTRQTRRVSGAVGNFANPLGQGMHVINANTLVRKISKTVCEHVDNYGVG